MTRNVDLQVMHVINTTEVVKQLNHTIVPGSTLVLDFPFFHHPVSLSPIMPQVCAQTQPWKVLQQSSLKLCSVVLLLRTGSLSIAILLDILDISAQFISYFA